MGSQMYKFGSLRQLCLKNSDHVVVSITQPVAVSTNTVTYRPQELQRHRCRTFNIKYAKLRGKQMQNYACIINDVAFLVCTPDRRATIDALNLRLLIGCHSLQMPKELRCTD